MSEELNQSDLAAAGAAPEGASERASQSSAALRALDMDGFLARLEQPSSAPAQARNQGWDVSAADLLRSQITRKPEAEKKLDVAAVQAKLEGAKGREYWRSLDDLASTPEFRDLLEREF